MRGRRVLTLAVVAALSGVCPMPVAAQETAIAAYLRQDHFVIQKPGVEPPLTFATEGQAQAYCPSDTVVWIDTAMLRWYLQGSQRYGDTTYGAYGCRHEAAKAGYLPGHEGE